MKNIVILGSTGTVGKNVLEVVRRKAGEWNVLGLACRNNRETFALQLEEFLPSFAYMQERDAGFVERFGKTSFFYGREGLEEIVSLPGIDLVIYAIPGIVTLNAFIRSLENGQRIGLATKEIMVVAGSIVGRMMEKSSAVVLPVDSEHNAIFQALLGEDRRRIRKVYLTASGGPFHGKKITNPTVSQVLSHPVWNMGEKITVDSATMFNKAFELIEAHYLFSLPPGKLDVLIHPEAVIHGLAEMDDGTVKGIFSMPDMKYPISFVMDYPGRRDTSWERIDFGKIKSFTLEPADRSSRWFSLALEAIEKKGSFPVVLNSANEEAVNLFLRGKIGFRHIPEITEKVLSMHSYRSEVSIEDIYEIDRWAKEKAAGIAGAS